MTPVLTSTYQIMQCFFAITGAQLLARFRTNHILAASISIFGLLALILIIIDASTGGTFHRGEKEKKIGDYGKWTPWLLFAIYLPMGGCLGIIELVRRVLPRDIVGENPDKLKKMDATVHIFYEVAGTSGAFASTPIIKAAGPVFSLITLPVFFSFAAVFWLRIKQNPNVITDLKKSDPSNRRSVIYLWFHSVKRGAQIVFSERRFIWLMFGYVLPFVFHRFIENVIFPTFAKQVLKEGSLAGILVAGSNLGELLGALGVLVFTTQIPTPLPWVRYDAIALMTLWVFPFFPVKGNMAFVWSIWPLMVLLSSGWAAGDVSLVAYIQSRIHSVNKHAVDEGSSPLGCVMAFLYSSYIIVFMIISIPMGQLLDSFNKQGRVKEAFTYVSGVMITIGAVLIFGSTFIPKGSFAWNPKDDPEDLIARDEDVETADKEKGGVNIVEAISMG
jgi:hypothetical protein